MYAGAEDGADEHNQKGGAHEHTGRLAHQISRKPTSMLIRGTTGPIGDGMQTLAAPAPMPRWPANWQSATFDAVAVKKSYILSPPEIFAECTHHGETGKDIRHAWAGQLPAVMGQTACDSVFGGNV